jgi:CRP-like cAMP-binding protein
MISANALPRFRHSDAVAAPAGDHLALAWRCARTLRNFTAGAELYAEGEPCPDMLIVTEGWAILYTILEDGRRQILDIVLPGDVLAGPPRPGRIMRHTAECLTDVTVAVVPHEHLRTLIAHDPALAFAVMQRNASGLDAAYAALTTVGRKCAREAVASFLHRLYHRARALDPSTPADSVTIPLTLDHIGDALGLTGVHVCRTLKGLKDQGILKFCKGALTIYDPARLRRTALADYDSAA